MSMSFRVTPNQSVRDGLERAVDRAVWEAAEFLLGEANRTVPHATGALERSGDVVKAGNGVYDIVYRTPYAARQHEDTSLRHPDPSNPASRPEGRAKWLSETVREQQRAVDAILSNALRDGAR